MYASHLINGLSSTAIEGKAPLEVWSGKATQDHGLLRQGKFASKEVCVFGCQKIYERLQVMGS